MTPRPWQGPQPEPSAEELARGWRWVEREDGLHRLKCGEHVAAMAWDNGDCTEWNVRGGRDHNRVVSSGVSWRKTVSAMKLEAEGAANECGEWGRVVIDEPMCSRADFEAKVADVEARGAASLAYARGRDLVASRHFKQLRRFLKATASHRGWMGALSVNVGGVDVVVDYAALRAIVADIERIGGEA